LIVAKDFTRFAEAKMNPTWEETLLVQSAENEEISRLKRPRNQDGDIEAENEMYPAPLPLAAILLKYLKLYNVLN